MTYDRLQSLYDSETQCPSAFAAVAQYVPPTFQVPHIADLLARVHRLEAAVLRSSLIGRERKELLIHRIAQWREWERRTGHRSSGPTTGSESCRFTWPAAAARRAAGEPRLQLPAGPFSTVSALTPKCSASLPDDQPVS
jgi:hypothetical protein